MVVALNWMRRDAQGSANVLTPSEHESIVTVTPKASEGRLYTRVFASILDSSINVQSVPPSVRWLWITMLLIADGNRTGVVDMPIERLAARAGLSLTQTNEGLAVLSAPDEESASDDEQGRRIVPIREDSTRGWKLVNWEKYKAIAKEEQQREQTRLRVAAFRDRITSGNATVTERNDDVTASEAEEETKAKAKRKPSSDRKRPTPPLFDEDSKELRSARYLFAKIRRNNPTAREPNWQAWARDFAPIYRIDKREPTAVKAIIDWCQDDSFWRAKVLSPANLREKFDRLTIESKPKLPSKPPERPSAPYKAD